MPSARVPLGVALVVAMVTPLVAIGAITLVPHGGVRFERIGAGFDQPVDVVVDPGDEDRLLVIEKTGLVRGLVDGVTDAEPFLDLRDRVSTSSELGLLGLAFPPDHVRTGRLYVSYTDLEERSVVARVVRRNDRVVAHEVLLVLESAARHHNGGHLAFGPDGMLYAAFGDGGDPARVADPAEAGLFGSIVRLDVSVPRGYRIPPDNPYGQDDTIAPETWLRGLRNPWRFSFDPATGDLYVADVGEDTVEEVSRVPPDSTAHDLGWPRQEGNTCLVSRCPEDLVAPMVTYDHMEGRAVIGGFVLRRPGRLQGHYLFADFADGWIREVDPVTGRVRLLADTTGNPVAIVPDGAGEAIVVDHYAGELHRLILG